MKKINFNRALVAKKKVFLFLLPAMVLLAGCKPGEENNPAVTGLQIEPKLITCPATGGDYTIEVSSPNGEWTAMPSASWIRVMPASGEKGTTEVRVKIDTNKESAESKGFVTFVSGEEKVEMPVSRAAKAAPYLRVVSEKALNTPKEGGSYTVQVESNIKWSISSNTGWAKVSKGVTVNNDNITITVDAATMPQETEAVIVVKPYGEGYDAGSDTVYITRGSTEATSLTVDPEFIEVPENGGSYTINVSSNAQWRVYKSWDMDWVTFTGTTEGSGSGSFGIAVEEATSVSNLYGYITIEEVRSDNYKPVQVQVCIWRNGKAAASLSVTPTTINAPAEGGEYSIEIESNYPWTASTSGRFFSISTRSGEAGESTMVVTINPAADTDTVTGHINIYSSFGGEQARINIKREGIRFSVTPLFTGMSGVTLFVPADGGKYDFLIENGTGQKWEAASSNEDVARIAESGDTLTVTVYVQTDRHDQTNAIITVKAGTIERNIFVSRTSSGQSQYAEKPFSIGSNRRVYFSHGNLQYKEEGYSWRFANEQYDYIAGNGDGTVKDGDNTKMLSEAKQVWVDLHPWGGDGISERVSSYSSFDEWGHHQIADKDGYVWNKHIWWTMSKDEWEYLLKQRANASNLRGLASIKLLVPGSDESLPSIVLLPDEWVCPTGLSFYPDEDSLNVYTLSEWREMEKAGAVLLPYTFMRKFSYYYNGSSRVWSAMVTIGSGYWTSTPNPSDEWGAFQITGDGIYGEISTGYKKAGFAVRLVRDAY